MVRSRLAALLFTLTLAACASTQLGKGSSAWHAVRTEHFTLYTDLPEGRAKREAEDFERWLAAFLQHGWEIKGRFPLRLNIVIFRSDNDFHRHATEKVAGYHVSEIMFEPWIVMPRSNEARSLEVFRHELTHYIAGLAIYREPAWFAEGIATYFETARFEGQQFSVGGVPLDEGLWLSRHMPMRARELFSPETDRHGIEFYASSWIIVHYLMNEQSDAFARYQDELAVGASHELAWQRAFPNLPPDELDARVRSYLRADEIQRILLPVEVERGTARATTLSRADEYALQGILWQSGCVDCSEQEQSRRSEQSFAAALREDPQQVQAATSKLLEHARRGSVTQADVKGAEALAQAHPDAWLAWMTLGVLAHQADDFERVREAFDPVKKLEELAPDHPYTHFLRAFQFAQQGQRTSAIREAERARRTSKGNPNLLAIEARLLASLSACSELHEAVRTLDNITHGHGVTPRLRAEIDLLDVRCKQGQ